MALPVRNLVAALSGMPEWPELGRMTIDFLNGIKLCNLRSLKFPASQEVWHTLLASLAPPKNK